MSGAPAPAGTADRTLMVLAKAPIRSRPPNRLVGVSLERIPKTFHSSGTEPVTDSGSDQDLVQGPLHY
jgi:hypothetical protein